LCSFPTAVKQFFGLHTFFLQAVFVMIRHWASAIKRGSHPPEWSNILNISGGDCHCLGHLLSVLTLTRWKECDNFSPVTSWSHTHDVCRRVIGLYSLLVLVSTYTFYLLGIYAYMSYWFELRCQGICCFNCSIISHFRAKAVSGRLFWRDKNKFICDELISIGKSGILLAFMFVCWHT
jgi:hypothetical protein